MLFFLTQVFCVNGRHGCKFIGRLDQLPYHLQQYCKHNEVPCPDCGRAFPQKDVWKHRKWSCLVEPSAPAPVIAAATSYEATGLKADLHEYLERARGFRGKLAVLLNRASNRLESIRLPNSSKTAPPVEVTTQAFPWYQNPEVPSASAPAANLATHAARDEINIVMKTSIPEDVMLIDWPEEDDSIVVDSAYVKDVAMFCGFWLKLRHFRVVLDVPSSSGNQTTRFVVFELLVHPSGDVVVGERGDARLLFRREVTLTLKHPSGLEGDVQLHTFNCACAVGVGAADRWAKRALTAPLEWTTVREFLLCGRVEVVMRLV